MKLRLLITSLVYILAACSGTEPLPVETVTPASTAASSIIASPTTVITIPATPSKFPSRSPTSSPRSTYTPHVSRVPSGETRPGSSESITPNGAITRNCAQSPSKDRIGLWLVNYIGGTDAVEFNILDQVHYVPSAQNGGQLCLDLPVGAHEWNARLRKHSGAPKGIVSVIPNRPLEPINFCLVDDGTTLSTICQSGPPTPTLPCCD